MDPISQRLDHWVRFISRLATLSISVHHGYHRARNSLVGFTSLVGTISRTIANLSHFGSSLEIQDILLLWALLRVLRRLVVGRLLGHLGFHARPALPVWFRQLGSAPPAARPFALPSALPFGPSSSVLPSLLQPSAPSFGLPALPALRQPWPLANHHQSLPLPPHLERQRLSLGQPTGHYPPAAVSAPSAPLAAPPSAPPSGQLYGQLSGKLSGKLSADGRLYGQLSGTLAPCAPPSAPASGPPAVPAQPPWLVHLRQQRRQLQQSGPGSGGAPR